MKKTTRFAFLFTALLATAAAHAQDSYVGLSATTSGEVRVGFSNGLISEEHSDPLSWKLYGGYKLNDRFGVELGYLNSGSFKIANPAPGSTEQVRFKSQILYGAGTASTALTESLSLFGKAGLAYQRASFDSNFGAGSTRSTTRAMLGVGMDYKIGKNLSPVV